MSARSGRRVVITGAGICSPLGNDPDMFFDRLVEGRSGLTPLAPRAGARLGRVQPSVGRVHLNLAAQFSGLHLVSMDRASLLALCAARHAVDQAGWDPHGRQGERCGVFMGCAAPGMESMEAAYALHYAGHRVADAGFGAFEPTVEPRQLAVLAAMPHAACAHIAQRYHVEGESTTYSNACASSAMAIGEAFRRIRSDELNRALAGGADCMLTPAVLQAWDALRMTCVDPEGEPGTGCRPFSADRTGFAIGEGAAVLTLEAYDGSAEQRARSLCEVLGFGTSSDANHLLRQSPTGMVRAMRNALRDAGRDPEDVGHINANGSGTWAADLAETEAIKTVFGQQAYEMPISATKSAHGHLMGAAGAVELVATMMALRRQVAPPTTHWAVRDPQCDLDYVPHKGRAVADLDLAMSTSFAFGGSNACIVLARAPG